MNKNYFFIALFFLWPSFSFGESLIYDFARVEGEKIIIDEYSFEKKDIFSCNVESLNCEKIEEATSSPNYKDGPRTTLNKINEPLTEKFIIPEGAIRKISVSPDKKFIAIYSSIEGFRIYTIIDTKTGLSYFKKEKTEPDLLLEEQEFFSWKNDSSSLFYLSDQNNFPSIFEINVSDLLKKGKSEFTGLPVVTGKWNVADFTVDDKNNIYYLSNQDGQFLWSIYKKTPLGTTLLIDGQVSYNQKIFIFKNKLIYSKLQGKKWGTVSYDLNSKKIQRFHTKNISNFGTSSTTMETVKLGSLMGILVKPSNFSPLKNYKLLVWLHGGPYRGTSLGIHPFRSYGVYDLALNEIASTGDVVVLKIDYTGSYGYGKDFGSSIYKNVGVKDVKELMASIASLKKMMKVNDVKLVGASYGGYLSLKTQVAHPKEINGAFSINGVTNWLSLFKDIKGSPLVTLFGSSKYDSKTKKIYDASSITNHIKKISSGEKSPKIFLGYGDKDNNISPENQTLKFYQDLINAKKESTLLLYSDETHILQKKSSVEKFCSDLFVFTDISKKDSCQFEY